MAEGEQDIARSGNTEIRVKASTGLPEGPIKVPTHEGLFSKARRALSKVAEKFDTNKENKPPLGKAF
jgi:hypothetical protein